MDEARTKALIASTRATFGAGFIPLHRPVFEANEKSYLANCILSNFVSSVGARVSELEGLVAEFTGCEVGVATVNGTAALHSALMLAGVQRGDEVISQALTFVATANAISYVGASPVFVDVDRDTLGMSPYALQSWLELTAEHREGYSINKITGARIAACVPMHTFGLPARIAELAQICDEYDIPLIEDTAESLGSYVGTRHTGSFGLAATYSFNGNKIITTGGGGMIVTNDMGFAAQAKHLTTTAKQPHPYEFYHDETGYNYRMPNLNAALGVAQMEVLPEMLKIKAEVAAGYRNFCAQHDIQYIDGIRGTTPNYWLNTILLNSTEERDALLKATNNAGVMTRPIWRLMTELPMYSRCLNDGLESSKWLVDRVVNLPSSVPESEFYRLKT